MVTIKSIKILYEKIPKCCEVPGLLISPQLTDLLLKLDILDCISHQFRRA